MLKEFYTTDELWRLGRLRSKHMVAYLVRTRLLTPSKSKNRGKGQPLKFSYSDLVFVRAVSILVRQGVEVEKLRHVLMTLRTCLRRDLPGAVSAGHVMLVGKQVYLKPSPQEVVDLTANGQLAFHFMLDAPEVRAVGSVDDRMRVGQVPRGGKVPALNRV